MLVIGTVAHLQCIGYPLIHRFVGLALAAAAENSVGCCTKG